MTIQGKGGRPRVFNNPEELEQGIIDYFKWIDDTNKERKLMDEKPKPYTLSGICVYLDIAKDTFWEYAKKPGFSESVKRAKARVENYVEEGLLNGSVNAIGAIFNLKNNFGWTDKIDINTNKEPETLDKDNIQERLKELKAKQNKNESLGE